MTAAPATIVPGLPEDPYAPDFRVEVEGKPLDPETKGDVRDLKVTLDLKDLSSLEVKLNNYDDRAFQLKWSDSKLFQIGSRIHVKLGYADRLVSVFSGKITSLSPDFPSDGAPTLLVRALDNLVVLKGSKPPEAKVTWPAGTRDWKIVSDIADRHLLRFQKSNVAEKKGLAHPKVVQGNKDDLTFVKERAQRIDHVVFISTDADGKDTLFIVEKTDERVASIRTYTFAWGRLHGSRRPPSLLEFKPTISAADQLQSVTVRGWDDKKKKKIEYTALPHDTPGVTGKADATGPAAAGKLAGKDGKKGVVVNEPVASVEEAKTRAEALLANSAYRFLTATGKAMGQPELKPGHNIDVHGVGTRFSGVYYVEKVIHSLSPTAGLLSDFTVSKTYEGKPKSQEGAQK